MSPRMWNRTSSTNLDDAPPVVTDGCRVRVKNATIGYDQRIISKNLDVGIPDGSFTAIIGPNGCGKSTLLRAFARVLAPTQGQVLLDGKQIAQYGSKEVARRLGAC
ncbi:MAG: ABC transporter ATP-binding protein [Tessaracoccus sp.]